MARSCKLSQEQFAIKWIASKIKNVDEAGHFRPFNFPSYYLTLYHVSKQSYPFPKLVAIAFAFPAGYTFQHIQVCHLRQAPLNLLKRSF